MKFFSVSVIIPLILFIVFLTRNPCAQNGWYSQTSGTESWLQGICFTDIKTGTVVGREGIILRTSDGGKLWTDQASGTNAVLFDVSFTDGYTGTIAGLGGTILRTTDGGSSWISQTSGTAEALFGISFTSN